MKLVSIILCCFILHISAPAQYYLKGEVTNVQGEKLPGVKITVHSDKTTFTTTVSGSFEIPLRSLTDTVSLLSDEYEPLTLPVKTTEFLQLTLKILSVKGSQKTNYLASVIKNEKAAESAWTPSGEDYSSIIENPFVETNALKTTSFSANINRASYSNIRRFLNMNERVPPDAVRIEEMLNYFNFNYSEPQQNEVFRSSSYITDCPWNKAHQIFFLNICARKTDLKSLPPGNFVFLIDISGSMDKPNRLPLLKIGFRSLVRNLREIDTISIVTYGEQSNVALKGTSGAEKDKIIAAIEAVSAGGSTPGESGLRLAYKVAQQRFIKGGNNRIILATDGDFNVGLTSEKDLQNLIEEQYQTGIYLTCLGVGMGNYKDAKLSLLAQKGRGNFAYIDTEEEAEKVLVTELTQTLYAVADDVIITTAFNPAAVDKYRLIGFDNKRTALADTTSRLKGGEIGSGNALMVLFEVSLRPQSFKLNDLIADMSIRYKLPLNEEERTVKFKCLNNNAAFDYADSSLKKAACIALFGMKLRSSPFLPSTNWNTIERITKMCFAKSNFMDEEFVSLVAKAKKIYRRKNKFF